MIVLLPTRKLLILLKPQPQQTRRINIKKFFHALAIPFVLLALLISISSLKKKVSRFQSDPNNFLAEERYKTIYKIVKKVLFIKFIKVEKKGFEKIPKKPVLYLINHKSSVDPMVIIKCLFETEGIPYFCFLSKIENKQNKYIDRAMTLIETISFERDNLRQQFEAFEKQIEQIKAGRSIVVFPEGTRIYNHEIGTFKPAAIKAAKRTYIPIVPIVIYGSSGLLSDKDKQYANKDKTVYVEVLDVQNHQHIMASEEYIMESFQKMISKRYNEMHQLHERKLLSFKE